jgi:hypothetical protein
MKVEPSLERLWSLLFFGDPALIDVSLVERADFLVAAGDLDFRPALLMLGILVTSLPILFTEG